MSWRDDALVHAKDQDPKEAVGLLLNIRGKQKYYPCQNLAITNHQEFILEPMKEAGYNGLWVLIYTSAIMMVLRFWFAGPIVEKLGPLGLLATSAVLAIVGLYLLSSASGLTSIFIFF